MIFDCPLPAALPFVASVDCAEKLDQINRVLLLRAGATFLPALTVASLADKATYDAILAAVGANKGIVTPLIANMVIPTSESAVTGGNDNSTINGIPYFEGFNNVDVAGELHSVPQAVVGQLQGLTPYSDATRGFIGLEAIFFNSNGQAFVKVDGAAVSLIPLFNFRVSDAGSEGYRTQTMNAVEFTLPSGWSAGLKPITLNFDYKVLVNTP